MRDVKPLTREQVRRVDELAVSQYGVASLVLMENAGRGVVDVLMGVSPALGAREVERAVAGQDPPLAPPSREGDETFVAVLCGKGNNGGDGLVIARHLDIRGVAVRVGLLCAEEELSGDALANLKLLGLSGVKLFHLSPGPTAEILERHFAAAAWMVDAMLGTGATGEPRDPIATAIRWMNAQPGRRLAVDVPSGLDCDTGAAAATTVRADITCTFVGIKRGFLAKQAKPYLGEVQLVSIGLPPQLVLRVLGTYIGSD